MIPQPDPRDWQIANAQELQITDRQVLALLRDTKKRVDVFLKELEATGKNGVRRAQLEHSRSVLLAEQSKLFERLGDTVAARRAAAASRSARLSAAADSALLRLVGQGPQAQFLYDSALQVSQRAIDAALARMRLSALPLSQRIYRSSVWMNGRLSKLINETLATGLNAKEFAKRARDWFSPNTPGGVRYAAMRLARTEINNSFHAISAEKYATTPWCTEVDWNLSKSHPKPDICNAVAKESPYQKASVPARPHPQCMCYITAVYVDEDDFVESFLSGDYDDYLDGELEKNGWEVEEPKQTVRALQRPTPQVGSIATMLPDQAIALNADRAVERQNASNNLYDAFAYGNLFNRRERGIDRKPGVREYFANSDRVNLSLRNGDTAEIQNVLDEVDAAMQLTTNNEPLVVFRGVRKLFDDAKAGDLVTDPIYWSTALDPQQAKKFARSEGSKLLHLELPAGSHMIAENATETEVLLPRGTTVQVTRVEGDDVFAVLVPDEVQEPEVESNPPEISGQSPNAIVRDAILDLESGFDNTATEFVANRMGYKDPQTDLEFKVKSSGTLTGPDGRRLEVTFEILDSKGNRVGSSDRIFYLDDGVLKVRHEYIRLNSSIRGAGLASRWNSRNESLYRELGIDEIHLTANINVGGYAWAKQGYDFLDANQAIAIGNKLERDIDSLSPEIRSQAKELIARSRGAGKRPLPLEFAMLGWSEGLKTWPGKEFMLGQEWKGVKRL